MPATSPSDSSTISALKPRLSAQRRYMRSRMLAQSWASAAGASLDIEVAVVGVHLVAEHAAELELSRISRRRSTSATMSFTAPSSFSSAAISSRSRESARLPVRSSMVSTICARVRVHGPGSGRIRACSRRSGLRVRGLLRRDDHASDRIQRYPRIDWVRSDRSLMLLRIGLISIGRQLSIGRCKSRRL